MPRKSSKEESKKKKRKIAGGLVVSNRPASDELSPLQSEKNMRSLLAPLGKDQLIDLLVKLGMQVPDVAEEIRGVANIDPVHRKIFVRGLDWETTSETLCDAFAVHGEIEEGAVIIDKATGKSRCFGFITYKNIESARRALEEPSKLVDGRLVVCNLACDRLSGAHASADLASRKVYIGGLSPEISSETLLSLFGKHGEIEEGSVAYDKDTNASRGFGFVTYKTAEAAKRAIAGSIKFLEGRALTVKLADTQPKAKVMQSQAPAAVVPIAIPIPGYPPQSVNSPTNAAGALTYAPYLYHSPYPNAPQTHYLMPSQVPYAHLGAKKEPYGIPSSTPPPGLPGYPYYLMKS